MGKPAVTVHSRADEFKSEKLYVSDGTILMCGYCNVRLEYQRKDTVLKHVATDRHKILKEHTMNNATRKRQLSMTESLAMPKIAKDTKEEFIVDTTEAFLAAGIAVEKFDNEKMREWFAKHVKGGGDIPSASWMRQKYVPIVGAKTVETIKNTVEDQRIAILCDETTDKGGNCVFNVLFRLMEPTTSQKVMLAASVVLDAANATTCSQAIMSTLEKYNIQHENCVNFVTDSARYMTACFNALHVLIGPHLVHTQCWAHKVNLVGHIWQNELDLLNTVVAKIKNAFLNTRKRKHQYLQHLRQKYGNNSSKVKLFPMPVLTRWNSWFKSVMYINEYIEDIMQDMEELEAENAGVTFLKSMKEETQRIVKVQACFVAENSKLMIKLIDFLEGNKYPTANVLYSKLENLCIQLNLLAKGIFPEELRNLLIALPIIKRAEIEENLKIVAQHSFTKLKDLMAKDPSKKELSAIDKIFNPKNVSRYNLEDGIIQPALKNLPLFEEIMKSKSLFLLGYVALQKLVREELEKPTIKHVNLCQLICSIKSEFQVFAKFALFCVWFTCSNVDAERSFSRYSLVVSDRRRSLKPENAEIMTMAAFE